MQTSLKGFLAEQKRIGKNVPNINEHTEVVKPTHSQKKLQYIAVLEQSISALKNELQNVKNGAEINENILGDIGAGIKKVATNVANAVTGTISVVVDPAYVGSPEAQAFAKGASGKNIANILIKKQIEATDATAAVMQVFDKGKKDPNVFAKTTIVYDVTTKKLDVKPPGGLNINPNSNANN